MVDNEEVEAKAFVAARLKLLRTALGTREDADRQIAGHRKVVEGYLELYPLLDELLEEGDLETEQDDFGAPIYKPAGMEAALKVLQERNTRGRWYTVATIADMLDKRGWSPRSSNPKNAVRAALERLVEDKKIEKGKSVENAVIYRTTPVDGPPDDAFDEEPF